MSTPEPEPDKSRREHWDAAYGRVEATELSWYQSEPVLSLELVDSLALPSSAGIVDVGGGSSSLAPALARRGFTNLTVVDVSAVAQARVQDRAGDDAKAISWVVADILAWRPQRRFDLWHDRAVLHFLVDPADRDRYLATLAHSLEPGGQVIIGAFALDGPEWCSGLPTARYDDVGLASVLGERFELVESRREEHVTPAGVVQPFTWAVMRDAHASRS